MTFNNFLNACKSQFLQLLQDIQLLDELDVYIRKLPVKEQQDLLKKIKKIIKNQDNE